MNIDFALFIPLFIGMVTILQGTLNKNVAMTVGVAQATFLNNFFGVFLCIALYGAVKIFPQYFPEMFHLKAPLTTFKWWYLIPPILGLIIVAGLPYAISRVGAVKVTVGLVAAQMITSGLWDILVEHLEMNLYKGLGILCALLSVLFVTLSK